jgi:hypothetical protein
LLTTPLALDRPERRLRDDILAPFEWPLVAGRSVHSADSGGRAVGVTVGILFARGLATRLRYRAPPEEELDDRS